MNKRIRILLLTLFLFTSLAALECKKEVFVPAYNSIGNVIKLIDKSSVNCETLDQLKTVKISKKNYNKEMMLLKERLSMLREKEKYALEAKRLNDSNVKIWTSLEKSCQGDDALAAKKIKNDVIELKELIKNRLETIRHYIRLTEVGIKIGKKRYAPDK